MAWTTDYKQDTEVPGVGTASAVKTTANGTAVSVSRRLDTNDGKDIEAFLAECNAALARATKLESDGAAVVAKIEAVLNGAKG